MSTITLSSFSGVFFLALIFHSPSPFSCVLLGSPPHLKNMFKDWHFGVCLGDIKEFYLCACLFVYLWEHFELPVQWETAQFFLSALMSEF